jgi:hypothetical protein
MEPRDPLEKVPSLILFWADTRKLLTYPERKQIFGEVVLLSATPEEVLIQLDNGRKVVVVGVTDPVAGSILAAVKHRRNGGY